MDRERVNPEYVVDLKGRQYATYPGILDLAHRRGIQSLTTEVLQIPTAENGQVAVVMARLETVDGQVFLDVGDASPANTRLAAAALRIASTRAKGRVLRDACNIAEALADDADAEDGVPAGREVPQARDAAGAAAGPPPDSVKFCRGCGTEIGQGPYTLSMRQFGRPLCPRCQAREAKEPDPPPAQAPPPEAGSKGGFVKVGDVDVSDRFQPAPPVTEEQRDLHDRVTALYNRCVMLGLDPPEVPPVESPVDDIRGIGRLLQVMLEAHKRELGQQQQQEPAA